MSILNLSVVICTHNPCRDYLERVLDALKQQTLDYTSWELLLIDNASEQLLSSEIDLSWHPYARHTREEQLGLTPARLRGIKEAQAEIIVFVDDDNVLDAEYLEAAFHISKDYPLVGAWGGQIEPEFEEEPAEWTKPYWGLLAIRQFEHDHWSNLLHQHQTTPCGAGLCVRRVVAEKYIELVSKDSKRLALDRRGKALTSCGDSDLAFTACDIGFGTGQFKALKLLHLLPSHRTSENYLIKLAEGISYSHTVLDSLRGKLPNKLSWRMKLLLCYHRFRLSKEQKLMFDAFQRGKAKAIQELLDY